MNRHERERYESDYSGYGDYRNDEHYHSARNLTNDFERHYQRERGHWDNDRSQPHRSYHEGDMGNAYERLSREGRGYSNSGENRWSDHGRGSTYPDSYNRDRDRYSNYQDDYRSYQGKENRGWGSSSDRDLRGNIRQGYGISSYAGTSDRYNTLNSDRNRGGAGDNQSYYGGGATGGYGRGGSMGDSFPGSNRGVPDTTYGMRNYSDSYGTGSSYGGSNYGGGTGYSGGHRGGAFGNEVYGSSSGNYGGTSSMGGGTYGGRSNSGREGTSHNTDRGTREFGGF
ncbi:hypothetical protein [Pontibacter litorisediminis]|uniref:hypothetical protein n=1 Tax=Pontibacter litorisediminis TaxID=1846260 RepID=UPI0023ED1A42|nr:hypothetical protein [Pontibacter litorisediminis]